ncbi:hypothetical protein SSP24_40680 [Streptomyces spinoverrucosus]|uniref:Uncharacterized protein n=1 Tax=Streptomyces spinoverrucosus TaxID=284043 RepID=A0A4Y3VIQ6_9ACTN|nr:hypothetical protein SSP24_40680 [Streptomyces spinoverrucosus]GHB87150.1 hypothetical protein GCM10010397_68570 [Streptomyces spinoverrucosus]
MVATPRAAVTRAVLVRDLVRDLVRGLTLDLRMNGRYLTAPLVIPDTIFRWATRNTATIGRLITTT